MVRSSHETERAGSAIYTVIQSLIDSQEALVEIGEKLGDQDLKRFFLAESLKRAEFRGELESVLNQEGVGNLGESSATTRTVYRALLGLRFRTREADDHTLLVTAEQGEDAAREAYDNAMSSYLPDPIRRLLMTQAQHIQTSHDFVKAARHRAA
jgi:uncharacterized protein (TIGR02284 family)